MAGLILYQPRQRWRIAASFGAAALIHFAAIALASIHQHDQSNELPPGDDSSPPIEIVPDSPTDNPTPPPDVVDSPPIPNLTDESFPNENTSPPPIRRQDNRLVARMVKAKTGSPGLLTLSSAKVLALSAPRPEYPYEARRQKITGHGIFAMSVDPGTGRVIDVSISKSTGNFYLDNAAVAGLRKWRFKPGTVSRVKSPITFTMIGAQY